MKHLIKKIHLICFAMVVLSISCSKEDFNTNNTTTSTNEECDVKVTIQMPQGSQNNNATRGISTTDENEVRTIDVLAFYPDANAPSGWSFAYNTQGKDIKGVSSKKTFTASVLKNANEQTFVYLANTKSNQLASLPNLKGTDKNELLSQVYSNISAEWNANNDKDEDDLSKSFDALPMWGEIKAKITDVTSELTGISLMRAIARVEVYLSSELISADNFSLDEVYVYNSKTKGNIVPNPNNISEGKVIAPTIPLGDINNEKPLKYTVQASMNGEKLIRTIYLHEAPAVAQGKPSEATGIVIGGTYDKSGKTTYYRVDFLKEDNKTYRDILRNHAYVMNIKSVSGEGWDTPEEAWNSRSLNMEVEVQQWNDGDLGEIHFTGGNYLKLTPSSTFYFYKQAESQILNVQTDVSGGWELLKITELASDGIGEQAVTNNWLTLDKTEGEKYGDGRIDTSVLINVAENDKDASRTGFFYIKAGRMEVKITVIQSNIPMSMLYVTDENGHDITGIVFVSTIGEQPEAKTFNVTWKPISDKVSIKHTLSDAGNSDIIYDTEDGNQKLDDLGFLENANGSVAIKIRPTAITENDVVASKFFNRASKVDFSIPDGMGGKLFKSITIIQRTYNIDILGKKDYYYLDGSSHSINVLCDTNWKIVRVEEKGLSGSDASVKGKLITQQTIDNLTNKIGGANAVDGIPVDFQLINSYDANTGSSVAGLVEIEFESPDGLFNNIVVELLCSNEYYPASHGGWAGSNIYWNGSFLTFDDVNVRTHENYIGVYFQWGSLWGISSGGSITFNVFKLRADGIHEQGTERNWSNIPRVGKQFSTGLKMNSYPPVGKVDRNRIFLYEKTNMSLSIGDICKYLTQQSSTGTIYGKKWRMPTSEEQERRMSYNVVGTGWRTTIPNVNFGDFSMANGYRKNDTGVIFDSSPFFPAAGYRNNSGSLQLVGYAGDYWSGSAKEGSESTNPYTLGFSEGGLATANNNRNQDDASPVRCVVDRGVD